MFGGFIDPGDTMVDQIRAREIRLQVETILWAVKMTVETESRTIDYGRIAVQQLLARFVKWPEDGELEISQPATWWEHLKQDLRRRFPRLLGRLAVRMSVQTYYATTVLPAIDLPPELKHGMFSVFLGNSLRTEDSR